MSKALCLDISTKAGYAVLEFNSEPRPGLLSYGVCIAEPVADAAYPFNFSIRAFHQAEQLHRLVVAQDPHVVIIEETNLGKQRYSQKLLEFIHGFFVHLMQTDPRTASTRLVYISSSAWRSTLGVHLSKEDKKLNTRLATAKRKARQSGEKLDKQSLGIRGRISKKHVAIRYVNEVFGLRLKVKDNDVADAICLGLAYRYGAAHCDGT